MKIQKLKLAIVAAGVAGVLAAPNLFAYVGLDGSISYITSPYEVGDGGEFNAVTTPLGSSPNLGNFATFCLEEDENILYPPSGPYSYTINTGAVTGDTGAGAIDPHTGLTMDNISIGTAWLFSQFAAGTLTLDNGTGTYFDANRAVHAGELQSAIWFLEDEPSGVDNGYVSLAQTALGNLTLTQVEADSGGLYNVVALNSYAQNGFVAQDVLAVVPVPEPTSVGCFLLGLGVLAFTRRFRQNERG